MMKRKERTGKQKEEKKKRDDASPIGQERLLSIDTFQDTSFLIVFPEFFVFYTIISYVSPVIKFVSFKRVSISLE